MGYIQNIPCFYGIHHLLCSPCSCKPPNPLGGTALVGHVSQVRAVEAGDVFVRLAQAQLVQNVLPHALGGARRERRDRLVRKIRPQRTQLPVIRPELVPPLRNAVRFVDGEKRQRQLLQPPHRILPRQPFRGKVQQSISALLRRPHHRALLVGRLRAVQQRRRNPHVRQLRHLVLHQRDQR